MIHVKQFLMLVLLNLAVIAYAFLPVTNLISDCFVLNVYFACIFMIFSELRNDQTAN